MKEISILQKPSWKSSLRNRLLRASKDMEIQTSLWGAFFQMVSYPIRLVHVCFLMTGDINWWVFKHLTTSLLVAPLSCSSTEVVTHSKPWGWPSTATYSSFSPTNQIFPHFTVSSAVVWGFNTKFPITWLWKCQQTLSMSMLILLHVKILPRWSVAQYPNGDQLWVVYLKG